MKDELPRQQVPIIKAGDKIHCPKCLKPLYTIILDIFRNWKIKAEYFNPQPNVPEIKNGQRPLCPFCLKSREEIPLEKITWFQNGALFTQHGWVPHNPFPAKGT